MKYSRTFIGIMSSYFTEYLPIIKGLKRNSIRSYKQIFLLLFTFLKEEKSITPDKTNFSILEDNCVETFLAWLETCRDCSISTRNQRLSCLSSFAKYAVRKDPITASGFYKAVTLIPKKKAPITVPIYFTKEEIGIILRFPTGKGHIGYRDQVLLSVLYASGARAQELCDLTVADVRFGEKTSLKLIGKGEKARIVTIPEDCSRLLKYYISYRKLTNKSQCHVFSSQTHEHMTISCIEEIVSKYVLSAKESFPTLFREKRYTPHTFRHSIAVHMLEAGVPMPVIKNFLGHTSIETTMIYATVSDELKNKYLIDHSIVSNLPSVQKVKTYEDMGLGFLDNI